MKQWFGVFQLLPAFLVALAAVVGFRSTAPLLEPVIWPEKPSITAQPEEVLLSTPEAEPAAPEAAEESTLPSAGTGSYPDGVYTGTGTGYSGPTSVRVTVEGGQIVSVEITAHKDKDPFFSQAKGVIDRVLRAQSWQVDAVSGATYSSRGILEAVRNALTGSDERSKTPKKKKPKKTAAQSYDDTQTWADGVWTGSARGYGGTIKVRVTVKKGRMTAIDVPAHSGESASYFKKGKAIIRRILKKQSPNVDTVSGATYSSKGIREAVKKALNKAAKGKKEDDTDEEDENDGDGSESLPVEGTPQDGTWSGSGLCEQFGYSVTLRAVFRAGKLVRLKDFALVDNSDRRNVSFANRAWEELCERLPKSADGTVDTVSGATYSSKAILAAYRDAFAKAVAGEGREEDEEQESDPADKSEDGERSTEQGEKSDQSGQNGDKSGSGNQPGQNGDESGSGNQSGQNGDSSGSGNQSGQNGDSSDSGADASGNGNETLLKDGSYTVTVPCEPDEWEDFDSYNLTVELRFAGDVLTGMDIVSASDSSNQYYYDRAAKGAGKQKGIVEQLKAKNSASGVDVVSGATCSSRALLEAYKQGVKQAKEAAQ